MSEKLPVIYIPIKNGELVSSGSSTCGRGRFLHYTGTTDSTEYYGPVAAYEPRVGRCETCLLFRLGIAHDFPACPRLTMVARDGSGFCSEHEPSQ
jgi:hypothetical protein